IMAVESIVAIVLSLFLGGDACEEDFRYHDWKNFMHYRVMIRQPFYFITLRFFAKLPSLLFLRFSV
nr:hypothetical protein [Bacteroidales bacterium]